MAFGILVLRLVLGLTMAAHGAQKLFGWWDGPGLRGVHGRLGAMRFRGGWLPVAMLVTAEFGGGLAIAIGLLTPLALLLVTAAMLVAIATTHARNGFWNGAGGYEFNALIIGAAAAIAAAGPGRYSLDYAIGWAGNLSGAWWGAGVLAAAALGALGMLSIGRRPEAPAMTEAERRHLHAA